MHVYLSSPLCPLFLWFCKCGCVAQICLDGLGSDLDSEQSLKVIGGMARLKESSGSYLKEEFQKCLSKCQVEILQLLHFMLLSLVLSGLLLFL